MYSHRYNACNGRRWHHARVIPLAVDHDITACIFSYLHIWAARPGSKKSTGQIESESSSARTDMHQLFKSVNAGNRLHQQRGTGDDAMPCRATLRNACDSRFTLQPAPRQPVISRSLAQIKRRRPSTRPGGGFPIAILRAEARRVCATPRSCAKRVMGNGSWCKRVAHTHTHTHTR
jgi:hypothetical protein